MGGSSLSSSDGKGGSLSPSDIPRYCWRSENPERVRNQDFFRKRKIRFKQSFNIFGWYPASSTSGEDSYVGPFFLSLVDSNLSSRGHSVAGLGVLLQVVTQVIILLN